MCDSTDEKSHGPQEAAKEQDRGLPVYQSPPTKTRNVPPATFDIDMDAINSKFRQHDQYLALLEQQKDEQVEAELTALKGPSKTGSASQAPTPIFSPKSSSTHNTRLGKSLQSQKSQKS